MIHFDPKKGDSSELEAEIKKYFGKDGLIADIISEPTPLETKCNHVDLNWNEVKQELFNPSSKRMIDYPTVRILASGLENHIINGFHWQEVSVEVDRAIENRASAEIQNLQEESAVDWLWNVGALAPLLGLFGTVTGISRVFEKIQVVGAGATQMDMVTQLSSGIFEALWTTIYGLMAGIVLMIIYYYFKNTLDWIYNRWQSLFVHVTERL